MRIHFPPQVMRTYSHHSSGRGIRDDTCKSGKEGASASHLQQSDLQQGGNLPPCPTRHLPAASQWGIGWNQWTKRKVIGVRNHGTLRVSGITSGFTLRKAGAVAGVKGAERQLWKLR